MFSFCFKEKPERDWQLTPKLDHMLKVDSLIKVRRGIALCLPWADRWGYASNLRHTVGLPHCILRSIFVAQHGSKLKKSWQIVKSCEYVW